MSTQLSTSLQLASHQAACCLGRKSVRGLCPSIALHKASNRARALAHWLGVRLSVPRHAVPSAWNSPLPLSLLQRVPPHPGVLEF